MKPEARFGTVESRRTVRGWYRTQASRCLWSCRIGSDYRSAVGGVGGDAGAALGA